MCKAIVWIQTWDIDVQGLRLDTDLGIDVQGHRLDTDLGYRCARPSFGYRLGIWMCKAIVWIQTWDMDVQGHRLDTDLGYRCARPSFGYRLGM